jgi:hypothetical protein
MGNDLPPDMWIAAAILVAMAKIDNVLTSGKW